MRVRSWAFIAVALSLLGIPHPASASTIDQQQLSFNATTGFLDNVQSLAQTFTVGTSGEPSSISVVLAASSSITLNFLAATAGLPTSSVLVTASNPTSSPGWTTFDFSNSNLLVFPGEVLAFQPSTSVSGGQVLGKDIAYNATNPYTGGQLFINRGITAGWFISELTGQGPIGAVDAAFETQVAATPLPPAWTMMPISLAGFGFVACRRKSKPALVAT